MTMNEKLMLLSKGKKPKTCFECVYGGHSVCIKTEFVACPLDEEEGEVRNDNTSG